MGPGLQIIAAMIQWDKLGGAAKDAKHKMKNTGKNYLYKHHLIIRPKDSKEKNFATNLIEWIKKHT